MKRLFIAAVFVLAGIAGLGFYEGWFHLSADKTDHKFDFKVTVDKDKLRADEKKVQERISPSNGQTKEQPQQP